MAAGDITPTIETLAGVPGSLTSGSFTADELVTQTGTGATGVYSSNSNYLILFEQRGTPDASGTWVGGTSGAVWTPTAIPTPIATYLLTETEGFETGAAYNFALDSENLPTANTPYVDVVSKGYDAAGDAATYTYRCYAQAILHIPATTNPNEWESSGNLFSRIALSDRVYRKDNTGSGNSGTAPTFTAPTGFIVNAAADDADSNPATNAACDNHSQLEYELPGGQWATQDNLRLSDDHTLEFDPQFVHGADAIACVRFNSVGVTSAHAIEYFVTTRTKRLRTLSGLYSDAYVTPDHAISGFTQAEQISRRVRVYTKRSDLIFDTDDYGSDLPAQHDSTLTHYCDKTGGLTVYGIVDTAGGSGTASTNEATARANPFSTIAAAIAAGATLVYIKNQTHTLSAPGTMNNPGFFVEVAQDPTDPGGIVTISTGFVYLTNVPLIRFTDCTPTLLGTTSILTGSGTVVWFDACTFDANSFTLAANICDDVDSAIYTGCEIDAAAFKLIRQGTDLVRQSFDGCDFGTAPVAIAAIHRMVACRAENQTIVGYWPSSTADASRRNRLIKNNIILASEDGNEFSYDAVANSQQWHIGNIIENINVVSVAGFGFAQSGPGVFNSVLAHLTIPGAKDNYLYNDGSGGNTLTVIHRGVAVVGVLWANQECKSSGFTGNGGANPNRVGNWEHFFGTLAAGNWARLSDFPPAFRGLGSIQSATDPEFVDDRSGDTSGASQYHYNANSGTGGGDYNIETTSPLRSRLPANRRHAFYDLYGSAIPNNGTAATGAVQVPGFPDPAPTIGSIYPTTAMRGDNARSISIFGTNFVDGAVVALSGTGLTIVATAFVSATQLEIDVSVAADAALSARDVAVTNPDTQDGTLAAALTIQAASPPLPPAQWQYLPDDMPADAETVWVRRAPYYANSFLAVWNESAQEFTTVSNSLVIPWWEAVQWRSQ